MLEMLDQADRLRDMVAVKDEEVSVQKKDITVVPHQINSRVITITSGKGGVGKTNFALNLAIELRKQNKRVVIIDADLGLANIEVLFGIIPKFSVADILNGTMNIDQILTDGPMGIKFLSGGSGLRELMDVSDRQMKLLFDNFDYLDSVADIIIIDTGAGISHSVINFIKASTETVVVTTPEPTSITDAYALIKATKLGEAELPEFKIVINRVENNDEGTEIFQKLSKVSEKFLNIKLYNLGYIPVDTFLVKAVKRQQPVTICYPNSMFSKSIEEICMRLLDISVNKSGERAGLKSFMKKLFNKFNN